MAQDTSDKTHKRDLEHEMAHAIHYARAPVKAIQANILLLRRLIARGLDSEQDLERLYKRLDSMERQCENFYQMIEEANEVMHQIKERNQQAEDDTQ